MNPTRDNIISDSTDAQSEAERKELKAKAEGYLLRAETLKELVKAGEGMALMQSEAERKELKAKAEGYLLRAETLKELVKAGEGMAPPPPPHFNLFFCHKNVVEK